MLNDDFFYCSSQNLRTLRMMNENLSADEADMEAIATYPIGRRVILVQRNPVWLLVTTEEPLLLPIFALGILLLILPPQ